MAPVTSHRTELAKLCSSKDWSKAIRILDALVSQSGVVQDICNRAFYYSQLELHKHVIKDCDRAIQLNALHLQAYILKGHALSALGRKTYALAVWKQDFELAQHQSADLKKLLELEELLVKAKQGNNASYETNGPSMPQAKLDSSCNRNLTETCESQAKLCGNTSDKSEILLKSTDKLDARNELNSEGRESNKCEGPYETYEDKIFLDISWQGLQVYTKRLLFLLSKLQVLWMKSAVEPTIPSTLSGSETSTKEYRLIPLLNISSVG